MDLPLKHWTLEKNEILSQDPEETSQITKCTTTVVPAKESTSSSNTLEEYVHHTVNCGDHRCYNFRRIQNNTIRFRVQAKNDVSLCLSPDDQEQPDGMYEVFIGGWRGTQSVIRQKKVKDVCKVITPNIVSADEMRGFWLTISQGVIKVGREGEHQPFMSYTDPEILLHVTHYGFCTAYGSEGDWTFSDCNLGILSEMATCHTITQYDFNHVVVQAALEKQWKIVDALFQRDIKFNESALQSILLEAYKQGKKDILYGIMYSPFINLEKCILHGIENFDEDLVNYIFRHYDNFHEDFISETFKSVIKHHQLRTVKLLISHDTSYSADVQTILEAREKSTVPHNVGKDGHLQNILSLLNQRLDVLASELGHQATELNGHVQIPELCLESCHKTTCPRFHTLLDFHWQISLGGSYWLNLPQNIIYCMENTYCDPSKDLIALPRLDPSKPLHADLLCILGREVWKADFTHNCMKLKDTNSFKIIYLRRLHKDIPFLWYYQDDNGIWEEYKNTITSEIIERCKWQNLNKINFQINEFSYEICFNSMTQKNIISGKIRNIKRRPKRSYNHSNSEDSELHELLPPTWEYMKPLEVVKIVALHSQSWEYQDVYNRIFNKKMVQSNDVTIERIQNPYLWRSFQNRFQEMKEQNCNPVVLKLFHCTSQYFLHQICQENIDYRIYKDRYSYGAHFSQTINHAEKDSKSLNFTSPVFILAHVIRGTVTTYDPSLTRPPVSAVTNLPFDTAVDNIEKPNLYVKYESQEYYPEYIIKMKVQTQNSLSLFRPW